MKSLFLFFLKLKYLFFGIFYNCIYVGQYTTNRNYGDALNLLLLDKLFAKKGYKIIPQRYIFGSYYKRKENLQFIGSVLGETDKNSIIWGAGAISKGVKVKEHPKKVYAVRGPLTRNLLIEQKIECPDIYGDPALLLPQFYNPTIEPIHRIGLIPHYADQNKDIVQKLKSDSSVHYIDILLSRSTLIQSIYKEWKYFIDELCSCEVILSSSLHGLILGDAYKKPTLWMKFGDDVLGDDFKFYDYYASIGIKSDEIEPLRIKENHFPINELYNMATLKPIEKIDMNLFLENNPWK